jgi:hypothetical protein
VGSHSAKLSRYGNILWCHDDGKLEMSETGIPKENIQTFIIGLSNSLIGAVLERFIQYNALTLPCIYVHEDVLVCPSEDYLMLLTDIQSIFESNHRARITRQKDGFIWQNHVLKNLSNYVARRVSFEWHNALAGLPAFVCGAGPSLDVTAPIIAHHQSNAVILAADSSMRTLYKHGVCTDFVVSIDSAKRPDKCLPPVRYPFKAILAPTSPPEWFGAVNANDCYFLTSGQITIDWLSENGIVPTALMARESCGNTALELARYLGCYPIYLFGMDLALSDTNMDQRHATAVDPTIYSQSGFKSDQVHPRVSGNYTETVPTFAAADWRSLDQRLATWSKGLVFNVNDRGACLGNTTLIHPDNFVFNSAGFDKIKKLQKLSPPLSTENGADLLIKSIFDSIRFAAQHKTLLRHAFEQNGSTGAQNILRQLMVRDDVQVAFGAFAFKILPHLVEGDNIENTDWAEIIMEFEALICNEDDRFSNRDYKALF